MSALSVRPQSCRSRGFVACAVWGAGSSAAPSASTTHSSLSVVLRVPLCGDLSHFLALGLVLLGCCRLQLQRVDSGLWAPLIAAACCFCTAGLAVKIFPTQHLPQSVASCLHAQILKIKKQPCNSLLGNPWIIKTS